MTLIKKWRGIQMKERARRKLIEYFNTHQGLCQSEGGWMYVSTQQRWVHLYCLLMYIQPLLTDEDLRECQNVFINFLCALLLVSFIQRPLHFFQYESSTFIPISHDCNLWKNIKYKIFVNWLQIKIKFSDNNI